MSFWKFLPAVISAGATIYGASQTSKANDKAVQQTTEARNKATAVELASLEQQKQVLLQQQKQAAPGIARTQEIINRGSQLTPEQELAVSDSRTQAVNSLKGSSLRGSGRATSAIISDVDTRVRNNFMTSNQRSADSVASGLTNQYFNSGNSIANNAVAGGDTVSKGLTSNATYQAANTMGQGSLKGGAIGDVSAIIADTVKNDISKKRDSSYDTV